jgi:xylulokinase
MPLVAGVDSSTQSVKVVIRDGDSGELIAQASEPHPDGTEVDPRAWEDALDKALAKVAKFKFDALSIAGQQHGMVALDKNGEVIRKALLWNDTRSAKAAEKLNKEITDIHLRTGSRLVASFTASKVRWLFDSEPENAKRLAAIALPHDWLSWRLTGSKDINQLFTDRSDASGTGYFNPESNEYDKEVIQTITKGNNEFLVPNVLKPNAFGGETKDGIPIGAGAGDNAAAALGLGAKIGDLVISLGTSGTAFAVSEKPTKDVSGEVAGFADATGNFLPLACTLNAAKVFASVAKMLNVNLDEFSALALSAKTGAGGIRLLPHFDGERTPNRPNARGNYLGITNENLTRENLARAAIEGVIAGMVYAANSLKREGFTPNRVLLIGGAAKNKAVQEITASMFATSIYLPNAGEYVADGAAKQAAWALSGKNELPNWEREKLETIQPIDSSQDLISEYLDLISKV